MRGGGGNFVVVTSLNFQLHPGGTVFAGLLAHPVDRLPSLLRFYRKFVRSAPDELTVHAVGMTLPTGDQVAALVPVWSGDLEEGERRLAPLRTFGPPLADMVAPVPYVAVQSMLDAAVPYGRHNYWKSSFLSELHDAAAAAALVEYSRGATSPYSLWLIEHVHGAATRVCPDATAFGVRDEHFHFIAVASWQPADAASRHINWARAFSSAMQPSAACRVYMNILGEDESDRLREAYGDNHARLTRVKAVYDPTNLFKVNHNITPAVAPPDEARPPCG